MFGAYKRRFRVTLAMMASFSGGGRALAQERCPVVEEDSFSAVTGHLTAGSLKMTLVVPRVVNTHVRLVFHVESDATEDAASGFFDISAGGDRVRVRNGATLVSRLTANNRLVIRVFRDGDSAPMCAWIPEVVVSDLPSPFVTQRRNSFDPLHYFPIHRIGDPVQANAAGIPYSIGGVSMPVVTEMGPFVYLRDPAPATGLRAIESKTGDSLCLFVAVSIAPSRLEPGSATKSLIVAVNGLSELRRPIGLFLFNRHRERLRLKCGSDHRLYSGIKQDGFEIRDIVISPGSTGGGRWEMTCRVQVLEGGESGVYAYFMPHFDLFHPDAPGRLF